jgi:hypothetical protein
MIRVGSIELEIQSEHSLQGEVNENPTGVRNDSATNLALAFN